MSSVYLVRHGQAGLRQRYDELSPLGHRQARMLGEYFVREGIRFEAIWSGALRRQRETAAEVCCAFRAAGVPAPEIVVDPDWNEFDLEGVFREIAPQLAASDAQFRQDYEELLRLMEDESNGVHHTWSRCDVAVVRAWIAGAHPCAVETWPEFCARVLRAAAAFAPRAPGENVAVFTSATPIAIWLGKALGAADGSLMRHAGVMYNAAFTTLRARPTDLTLLQFNAIPHLAAGMYKHSAEPQEGSVTGARADSGRGIPSPGREPRRTKPTRPGSAP